MSDLKFPILEKKVCSLLFNFNDRLAPTEFVEEKFKNKSSTDKVVVKQFLEIKKYEIILQLVAEDLISKYGVKKYNDLKLLYKLYFILFELNEDDCQDFRNYMNDVSYSPELLSYLTNEDNQVYIAQVSCKYFDNDFTLNILIHPLLNKCKLLQEILEQIVNSRKPVKKQPTVPIELNCMKKQGKNIVQPPNTPELLYQFKAKKFPKHIYAEAPIDHEYYKELQDNNRKRALALLSLANSSRTAKLACPKEVPPPRETYYPAVKPTPVPPQKEVEVKGTVTSTLREANRYMKEQQNEIRKIEDIIKGGINIEDIEKIEAEKRQNEEKLFLENLQRKHLEGLLVYEQAILAKKNFEAQKQEIIANFKLENAKILEELEKWREEEQIKVKSIINKVQDVHKNAKEAEKKVIEDKQATARMLQYESKLLMQKYQEEKQKELEKKMELIQEIRAMEQMRKSSSVKEFDPTETPNYGFLCEMSIAELQERLSLTKIKMNEDLEEKRNLIQKKKEEQEQVINDLKKFVVDVKKQKAKPSVERTVTVTDSPEILALKRELELKRKLRKGM